MNQASGLDLNQKLPSRSSRQSIHRGHQALHPLATFEEPIPLVSKELGIEIRRGEPRDTAVLAGFNIAMAEETENLKLLPEVITAGVAAILADSGRGFYLVAESGNEIAGALMVTSEWSDWRNGFFWWIQSVYVRPQFRRQGIYRSLHEHLRGLAKSEPNICGLRLYVERDNQRAQSTYSRLGMHETHYLLFEELKPGLRYREEN